MFRFADLGRVWWPVELPFGFGEDGSDTGTIHLLFELFTDEELEAREKSVLESTARRLVDQRDSIRTVDDLLAAFESASQLKSTDRQAVCARVHDWRGVGDGEGTDVEFSADRMAALLAHRPVFTRVRDALFEASREGVRKN